MDDLTRGGTKLRAALRQLQVINAAPLSVRRGFRAADLQRLRAEPGLGRLRCM
jgi:hypothetical protein